MPDTGWKNATLYTLTDNGGSYWSGGGQNVRINDGLGTNTVLGKNGFGQELKPYKYVCNIPVGSTINGIQIAIDRMCVYDEGGDSATDREVYLMKNLLKVGDNKASATRIGGWATIYYGGAADLWGTSWSVADINAQNFGVMYNPVSTVGGSNKTVSVDWIGVRVYYTLGGFDNIEKIYGISVSDIGKINGISLTDIEKINGIT